MIKVLFVCLGNICRSPAAEGVFRALVRAQSWTSASMSTVPRPATCRSAGRRMRGRGRWPNAVASISLAPRPPDRAGRLRALRSYPGMDRANLADVRRDLSTGTTQTGFTFFLRSPGTPSARREFPDPVPYVGAGPVRDDVRPDRGGQRRVCSIGCSGAPARPRCLPRGIRRRQLTAERQHERRGGETGHLRLRRRVWSTASRLPLPLLPRN